MLRLVLPSEDSSELELFLGRLNDNAGTFDMHFAPWKCKMLFQDWICSNLSLVRVGKQVNELDRFS